MANNFPVVKTIKAQYVFANDAGGTGDRVISDSPIIPDNSIITNVTTYVSTAFTSGGSATVAVKIGGRTVVGAQDYNHASLADEAVTSTGSGTWAKTTSATKVMLTVATAALTAGVCDIYVSYVDNKEN